MVPCIRVVRGAPAVGKVPVLVRGRVAAVEVEVGRSMLVHKLERTCLDNHNHKDWPLAFLFDLKGKNELNSKQVTVLNNIPEVFISKN